ncbi:MAG TPA: arsenic resistance N-acetyltransferase ArsN2 [Xanthobacteraceae bacterium]|jgi:N-acetylglutamate synthase-like GNAT family acetyltransferase|nr:arsenic resistance N-acetyltransferase ArsN2 [Xanthobacteraceae bacterium]
MTGGPRLLSQPLAAWERDGLAAALARAGLPTEDLQEPGRLFWRFERDDVPIGFGGLEVHGDLALLRSIVTLPPLRNRGFGAAIVTALEAEAWSHGCRTLYLLTASETAFFAELGYSVCPREDVPSTIRDSRQFAKLSRTSATVMVKRL